jgi:hypothetical protein
MNAQPIQSSPFDQRYYQTTGRIGFARKISIVARRRVHRFFMRTMEPNPHERILDIGTTDDTGPDANMLEQLYPHRNNLTCASLSDGQSILNAYPGVKHFQIAPGESLPFGDNSFDIVYSSAVLEHVGSVSCQKHFIQEMCRVGLRRFLVVPNRSFPIEHHTCLPLVHYLPKPWFRRLLRGTRYDFWSHETNLNYVSATGIQKMWPGHHVPSICSVGIGFGPWKSNLIAYQTIA